MIDAGPEFNDDLLKLFLEDVPLLDVRAPVEYRKGAFPCSTNVPLLDDEQRHVIGTRYKEQGQDAAIDLGWTLATDDIRQQRIASWQAFIQQNPTANLYCFRGGLRSRLSQQLLRESGVDIPIVQGGYKALRRFLIDQLESSLASLSPLLISGRTGSGKTLLIDKLSDAIDLEGLANHRGSAFGRQLAEQPTQIDFENSISVALLKLRQRSRRVFIEDEGKLIGRLELPLSLRQAMNASPKLILETPLPRRVEIVLQDYIYDSYPQYLKAFGEDRGRDQFRQQILGNLQRIKKRLGGARYAELESQFSDALTSLEQTGKGDLFVPGIELLLRDYYDPMYDYQLQQRSGEIMARGSESELIEWSCKALTR